MDFQRYYSGRNRLIKNDKGEFFQGQLPPPFYFKHTKKARNIYYYTMSLLKNVHISVKVESRVYSKLFKIIEGYRSGNYAQKLIFGLGTYFLYI